MMAMAGVEDIERIAKLERRVRLLTTVTVALIVAMPFLAYFSLRAPLGQTVSAREFLLLDQGGGVRGRWGVSQMTYATSDSKEVTASTTCLLLNGRDGHAHLNACTSWDAPPQTSLMMTDSKAQRLLLSADDESAEVSVGRRRDMGKGDDNAKVAIVAGDSAARVSLQGKRQRGTFLSLDGIVVFSEDRRTLAQIPAKSVSP